MTHPVTNPVVMLVLGDAHAKKASNRRALLAAYSGSEAKAHPFRGGMKPTTGNLSTLVATGRWMLA